MHHVGELAEVLDNLGVFGMMPTDVIAPCASGFRRVPIHESEDSYLSLQGFAPNQVAYAHTHPDSEEWVVVIGGSGLAMLSERPVAMSQGQIIGRAAANPHGFRSADEPLHLLSIQLPRPSEPATTWDEPGETTDPDRLRGGRHVPAVRAVRRAQRQRAVERVPLRELRPRVRALRVSIEPR